MYVYLYVCVCVCIKKQCKYSMYLKTFLLSSPPLALPPMQSFYHSFIKGMWVWLTPAAAAAAAAAAASHFKGTQAIVKVLVQLYVQ